MKQHLRPKLTGIEARGTSEKKLGPLLISAIVEASKFKFGHYWGFGSSYLSNQATTFRTKSGGDLG